MSATNAHHFSTTLILQLPAPVAQLSLLAVLTTTESSFSAAASLAILSTISTMSEKISPIPGTLMKVDLPMYSDLHARYTKLN